MGEKLGGKVRRARTKCRLNMPGCDDDNLDRRSAGRHGPLRFPPTSSTSSLALSASERRRIHGHRVRFGNRNAYELILNYRGQEVGRLSMDLLHNGIPMPTRKAVVEIPRSDTGFQLISNFPVVPNQTCISIWSPIALPPQHRQQALDHPPVRPRSSRRVGDQTPHRAAPT